MLTLRRGVVWAVAVLLVSGVASAQTPTASGESAELAALRVQANAGDATVQAFLGVTYDKLEDYAEAMAWYRKAADQGHTTAQFALGLMYELGKGVPQDDVSTHMWYSISASLATGEERKVFAIHSARVAVRMTPAQLVVAQQLAREWLTAFEQRGGTAQGSPTFN
jgi:TPR repeat protein